jgi:hypothetical protein
MSTSFKFLFSCLLGIASVSVYAEISSGFGEYLYGPDTSESKACEYAQNKAKSMAISAVSGEAISNEQLLNCKETGNSNSSNQCEYNSITWSLIEGDIKSITNLVTKTEKRSGATSCVVTLSADVVLPSKKPDPNFQIKAKTNQTVYRTGDDFTIEIESTVPSYFAIFNWLPDENDQINRVLLRSAGDVSDSDILKKNANGGYSFKQTFTATWSKEYALDKKMHDEWIVVIVTKKPAKWLNTYDQDNFKATLREIPNDERRIKRMGYQLSK